MTKFERENPKLLNGSRRKRIADGSGTTVQDVNRLIKQFDDMTKMMKNVSRGGKSRFLKSFGLPQNLGM
jgi:signal recognition particle subunit SRP54